MAARSIWKGSIGFGMVHIPVALYTATADHDVKFNRWDPATGVKPRQVQLDGNGKEMAIADMTRVFEVAKGEYVEITDEALAAIAPESSRHMDVLEFVPRYSVDTLFIEKTYFLGWQKGGEKAYALLVAALEEEDMVGIVKVLMSTKEHLAMVWVDGESLCLSTLFYEDEVKRANSCGGKFGEQLPELSEREVTTARMLVTLDANAMFDPAKYRDDHRDKILAMIERLRAGEVIESIEGVTPTAPVANLLDVLQASIDKRKAVAA